MHLGPGGIPLLCSRVLSAVQYKCFQMPPFQARGSKSDSSNFKLQKPGAEPQGLGRPRTSGSACPWLTQAPPREDQNGGESKRDGDLIANSPAGVRVSVPGGAARPAPGGSSGWVEVGLRALGDSPPDPKEAELRPYLEWPLREKTSEKKACWSCRSRMSSQGRLGYREPRGGPQPTPWRGVLYAPGRHRPP